MSEQAPTIFRAEALRARAAGTRDRVVAAEHSARVLMMLWALVGLLLGVWLLTRSGRDAAGGAMGGLLTDVGGLSGAAILAVLAVVVVVLGGTVVLVRTRQRGRVPVLLQMSAVECGAACLAMILSFHGRGTRVAECSTLLGVGRDGLTARAIAEGARIFGLRVRAYSLNPADFARVTLPAVVHWEFNHFLVVERWRPERVDVVDPGSGRRRLTAAEFDHGLTGVTLLFEAGHEFARRRMARPPWLGWLRTFATRHRGLFGQVLAASLLLQLLGLALPVLSKVVIDDVLPAHDHDLLSVLGIGLAVLVTMQAVLSYLRGMLFLALRARMDGQLVPMLFERLLALPYRFFEQRRSGDLISRVASVSLVRETLTGPLISTFLDATLALGYVMLTFSQDAIMGAAVLVLGALQALLIAITGPASRDLTRRELAADAAGQSYLVEALTGIATLKASGTEEHALRHWSDLFHEQIAAGVRKGRQTAVVDAALAGLRTLAPLGLLWLGATRVLDGQMSLGTLLATTALAATVLTPLGSLVASAQRLQLVMAHADRLGDIVLAEPEQNPAGARPAPQLTGAIELEQVSFRYDARSPLTVDNVSVSILPGQKIAIVGRSGSGKSTLGKLLLGLYYPTQGEIRFDGLPARELTRSSLRRQVGVVLQEPVLFSGSIRDNIAFNDPGAPMDRVIKAARLAEIHDEIQRMPMGYETPLSESGVGLSGGQRQRIALARATLHRPRFLLLDEATSHLDTATESAVEHNLSVLACTRIVIAHRLSTVEDADITLIMERGRVLERR